MRKTALALASFLLAGGFAFPSLAQWAAPGGACTQEGANANSNGFLTCTGGVWVSNAVVLGTTAAACDASKAGYIRYNSGSFEGCNGSAWVQLAGGGTPTYSGVTTATYSGNLGGPAGANAKCSAEFPGSRIMKASEVYLVASSMGATYGWVVGDLTHLDPYGTVIGEGGCRGYSGTHNPGADNGIIANNASLYWSGCGGPYAIHCVKN